MAAATGASLRELMERMGHSSSRAALIYQHATRERDEAIASALGEALARGRRKPLPPLLDPGTQPVRLSPGSRLLALEFLDQRAHTASFPLRTTVEDRTTSQPESRQNPRSEVPSEEMRP